MDASGLRDKLGLDIYSLVLEDHYEKILWTNVSSRTSRERISFGFDLSIGEGLVYGLGPLLLGAVDFAI